MVGQGLNFGLPSYAGRNSPPEEVTEDGTMGGWPSSLPRAGPAGGFVLRSGGHLVRGTCPLRRWSQ